MGAIATFAISGKSRAKLGAVIDAPLPQAATLLPRFRALREIPAAACQPLAHRQDHAPQTSALIGCRSGKDEAHPRQCLMRRSSLIETKSTPSTRLMIRKELSPNSW